VYFLGLFCCSAQIDRSSPKVFSVHLRCSWRSRSPSATTARPFPQYSGFVEISCVLVFLLISSITVCDEQLWARGTPLPRINVHIEFLMYSTSTTACIVTRPFDLICISVHPPASGSLTSFLLVQCHTLSPGVYTPQPTVALSSISKRLQFIFD